MIPPIVGQEGGGGFDFIWLLLPLLCCMMSMGQRGGGPSPSQRGSESESWFTSLDIESAYKMIDEEASRWREKYKVEREDGGSIIDRLKGILGGGEPKPRFLVDEEDPPKLLVLSDQSGPIYFELTEVEGGGTVVKSTYDLAVKRRIARLKTDLPVKIPATPIGLRCPACGKPVMPEFDLCPYCGERLVKESGEE